VKLIVIVPYRDREEHLEVFVPAMHEYLKNIPHEIIVVEQSGNGLFNRGKLLNIGFDLCKDRDAYFCFHDVDLIPVDDSCDYRYPVAPTQLVGCLGPFRSHYREYCGGVMLFRREDFLRLNGYGNQYCGWGCEDDDLYKRLWQCANVPLARRNGRYRTLERAQWDASYDEIRVKRETNPHYQDNLKLLGDPGCYDVLGYSWRAEGLCNLKYEVLEIEKCCGYVKYRVRL